MEEVQEVESPGELTKMPWEKVSHEGLLLVMFPEARKVVPMDAFEAHIRELGMLDRWGRYALPGQTDEESDVWWFVNHARNAICVYRGDDFWVDAGVYPEQTRYFAMLMKIAAERGAV